MLIDDFFNFFNGIYCDYDGADGDQCFDLANAYSRWIGGQRFTGATADLIYNQPGSFYTQIVNTPDFVPIRGDIVVWNWPHVGIATGSSSNTTQFEVLEQNDPANSNCHYKIYPNYNGVIGVLRPKSLPETPTVPPQPEFTDQTRVPANLLNSQNYPVSQDIEVQAIRGVLGDYGRTKTDYLNTQTALATANNKIMDQAGQIQSLQKDFQNCQQGTPPPNTPTAPPPDFIAWLKKLLGL